MNNEIKFGALIHWLNGNKIGTNPFNVIPDCPGIYKIFVPDEYREQIEFGAARTVNGKVFCPPRMKKGKLYIKRVEDAKILQDKYEKINSNILYIGMAGRQSRKTGKVKSTLRQRLQQYAEMALGKNVHSGGIDIFAVQDYDQVLCVAWYPLGSDYNSADEWETAEIEKFKQEHNGQRPLANRSK